MYYQNHCWRLWRWRPSSGAGIGYWFRLLVLRARKNSIEIEIQKILIDAREDAKKITSEAEEEAKQKLVVQKVPGRKRREDNPR